MTTKTVSMMTNENEDGYSLLEMSVRERAAKTPGPYFTTEADPDKLWSAYLDNISVGRRQHYNCHTCRRFIQKYGGLVVMSQDGYVESVLWAGVQLDFFARGIENMRDLAVNAKVAGVFLSSDAIWGIPNTGPWTHLSAVPHLGSIRNVSATKTDSQAMAEKVEEFGMLCRGVEDYNADVVAQAVRVLESGTLYRSEKAEGVARWLMTLHNRLAGVRGPRRNNILWATVATAPPGFCHVRSTVISTLLDDILAGMDVEVIKRRWAEKLNPTQYQRPTAAPSEGAIKQAEELVAKLGLAPAFERRFATLDDVLAKVWSPPIPKEESGGGGLFDHLRKSQKSVAGIPLPKKKITWEKFAREVLPNATGMEVMTPFGNGPFYGLVTAVHPDAPPLFQWDGLEGLGRNPVSYYFYTHGSPAHAWGLLASTWTKVTAIFLPPHCWQVPDRFKHQGRNVLFALEECREKGEPGLALFPETLRNELHGVRSVIEAHSNKGKIQGAEVGNANGLAFSEHNPILVRVRDSGGTADYEIDRWD